MRKKQEEHSRIRIPPGAGRADGTSLRCIGKICVPLKGGKDPLAGRGSHTRCMFYVRCWTPPPAIRLVPLPFQGRTSCCRVCIGRQSPDCRLIIECMTACGQPLHSSLFTLHWECSVQSDISLLCFPASLWYNVQKGVVRQRSAPKDSVEINRRPWGRGG